MIMQRCRVPPGRDKGGDAGIQGSGPEVEGGGQRKVIPIPKNYFEN